MAPKRGGKTEEAPKAKTKARAAAKEEPKARAKAEPKEEAKPKAKSRAEPEEKPKQRGKAEPKEEPEEQQATEDYSSWSIPKLKEKLKELSASTSGGKDSLVERLKALAPSSAPKASAPKAPAKRDAPKDEEPQNKRTKNDAAPKAKAQGVKRDNSGAEKATSSAASSSAAPIELIAPAQVYYEDGDFKVDYAKTNRSSCKKCFKTIEKDALRIGKMVDSDKFDGKMVCWHHPACVWAGGLLPRSIALIDGFSSLRPEDQEEIKKKVPLTANSSEGDNDGELDGQLQEQSAKIHKVLDAIKDLSDNDIKELLDVNGYPSIKLPDGAAPKRQLCADGIIFGAVGKCQQCDSDRGYPLLSGESYKCAGWVNKFLKCTFETQTPERTEWQFTPKAQSAVDDALGDMELGEGERLFTSKLGEKQAAIAGSSDATKPPFLGLTFVITEMGEDDMTKEQLTEIVRQNGGALADTVTKATTCVITSADVEEGTLAEVDAAKELGVPGVSQAFIIDSVENSELEDMEPHLLWGEPTRSRRIEETVSIRFVEKRGINIDADIGELTKTAHVLVEKSANRIYSEMLNKTDMVSGANSFYLMHLLEGDSGGKYWVYRKWGRIGVSQGGTKLEEFGSDKDRAIASFCKNYFEKTGNTFGHKKDEFEVKTGKFLRVDVQHSQSKSESGQVKEGGDQPLGKLSKKQIELGDAVLDKIEAAMNDESSSTSSNSAVFFGLSAEYYSIVPHNFGQKKPPVINTAELHGAEKALLQFYLRMGFEEMGGEEEEKLTPISGVMQLDLPASLTVAAKPVCGIKDITNCTKKGAVLDKKKAGKPVQTMTGDLYGSILLYTSNAIYKQLNKALREEDRHEVQRYFPYLRMLFEACARLPTKKQTLWRGVGVDLYEQYKVGSTIIWWGVSSCTSVEKVARDFMAGCGDGATLLTVETETACDIQEVSFFANEAESILLPGTKLEVMSSEKKGNKSYIRLRETGRAVN